MRNNGGPAFPSDGFVRKDEGGVWLEPLRTQGMSLRDYFAAAALTGVVSEFGVSAEGRAQRCYEYADAMLKEREKL